MIIGYNKGNSKFSSIINESKNMTNALFERNLMNVSTRAMADLIHYIDYPVDVKDVKTGRYIVNNKAASEVSGLTPEERIGLDVYDIAAINKIKNHALNKLVAADHRVAATSMPTVLKHIFLNKDGIILLDKVIKKPILGQNNQTIAILSCAYNLTPYIKPATLYSLYKTYYPKKQAIQILLRYLNITQFFNIMPTEKELQTLLVMEANLPSSKYVARLMQISPRTVEYYKSRLCQKLHRIDLNQLLMKLRTQAHDDCLEDL